MSSLAGAVLGVATKVPQRSPTTSANVVQLQLVVTGAHRQIGMLESDAFASLNNRRRRAPTRTGWSSTSRQRIDKVVDMAIKQIESYADPQPEAEVGQVPLRPPRAA